MPLSHESSQEEARQLLNGPPQYDDSVPVEQFEIEEPEDIGGDGAAAAGSSEESLLGSVRRIGKNHIQIPVKHIIDPVVKLINDCSSMFDNFVSRWANPFIVKRLIIVIGASVLIGCIYFKYIITIPSKGGMMDQNVLRASLKSSLSAERLQEHVEYFAEMPHLAGSLAGRTTASYVDEYFKSLGLNSAIDRHDVYLSHGGSNLLELRQTSNDEVVFKSELRDGQALEHPQESQVQPYPQIALVAPGEARGSLVYANFGSQKDLETVDVKDRIVLVKFGPSTVPAHVHECPGSVANRLQDKGARGILFMSSKHPTEPSWPEGADYNAESIQQSSIGSSWKFPGDILSPGWPSSREMKMDRSKTYTADIPAAALSWKDAGVLLKSLKNSGTKVPSSEWENNDQPAEVEEWWTGPNSEQEVFLKVDPIAEERHQITNVFGEIKGRERSQRVVFVGARLDAMCYGTSQLAGLTVILEVARVLAEMKYQQQWVPLRSIHFVLWDGTSHNFAGSTEWVESVADHLRSEGIAYIDLDGGVSGGDLLVQGNPILDLTELLHMVSTDGQEPSDKDGNTLAQAIDKSTSLKPIPGFGNHLAFEAHTGVPTVKLGFYNRSRPVPVDSCLDSIEWMQKFGDPDYHHHYALAELVSYLTLDLSDAPLVPLRFESLVPNLNKYAGIIRDWAKEELKDSEGKIDAAVNRFSEAVKALEEPAKACEEMRNQYNQFANLNRDLSGNIVEPMPVERMRSYWNEKLMQANKMTLDHNGLSFQRNWYKNHLFGPSIELHPHDDLSGVFPAVQDAIHHHDLNEFHNSLVDVATHIDDISLYLEEFGF